MSLTTRKIPVGGLNLELFEGGEGSPVLFLHGNEGVTGSEPFLGTLSETFRVVAPNLPGFGLSDLPLWINRADDFAYPVMDLMEGLGLADVVLVGVSLGGWVATEIAVRNCRRIRSMVLVSPLGINSGSRYELCVPDIFAMTVEDSHGVMFADPRNAVRDFSAMSDEELAAVARARETVALTTWEPYMHNPKLFHLLHRVAVPTLVLRGSQDVFTQAAYTQSFADTIPGAVLRAIPNAGHFAHIEQPANVCDAIAGFLSSDATVSERKMA